MAAKKKQVKHRVTNADLAAAPDLAEEGVKEGDVIEVEEDDGVPSFTFCADSAFGIRCMIAVRDLSKQFLTIEDQRLIAVRLREFDLYEEQHRS